MQDQGNLSESIDVLVANIENNVIFVPFFVTSSKALCDLNDLLWPDLP